MPDIAIPALEAFCSDVLTGAGVPEDDAAIIVASITYAHATGKGTHGASRLPIYVNRIEAGLMQAVTPLTELSAAPAMALLDAGDGFGQVAAIRGMDRAVAMARETGIGMVGIRHSHNFGTGAFVAAHGVAQGMATQIFANAAPAIAPTGGSKAIFGTNPISWGFPTPEGYPPIVLDMATSQVARGKIRMAALTGEAIPLGWALDARGDPTTDAEAALEGSMLPVGGAKGYGLSVVVDIMAGLMTRSASGGQAKNLNSPHGPSCCGHMLLSIDLERFLPRMEYDAQMTALITATKAAGPKDGVFLPGERSARYMTGREGTVPLSDAILSKLDTLASQRGVAPLARG
ncbi:Ldh family oxidoreductase [Tritonibacter scottomollicae]|uniref:LDH2 family malate/lactate/ureidoglycolate dehydrogenase n=1 Tax=Tritonibacter scottomollicae TaxID=483013 RepID=A0A2T1A5W8_TRISK|nr:Ldh family oxidoreductase [Tritonibacter scottomollicae]PRZ43867.1 LDH2 family malate/lactate/ureidoglycolate dehydrogenase [Tritonibacter scottomollicae]